MKLQYNRICLYLSINSISEGKGASDAPHPPPCVKLVITLRKNYETTKSLYFPLDVIFH